jgi:hypothetical protein
MSVMPIFADNLQDQDGVFSGGKDCFPSFSRFTDVCNSFPNWDLHEQSTASSSLKYNVSNFYYF